MYQEPYQLWLQDAIYLATLFLAMTTFEQPSSAKVVAESLSDPQSPACENVPVIVNTKGEGATHAHWIRAVVSRCRVDGNKPTGQLTLYDDLATTAASKHILALASDSAAIKLRSTNTQTDSWTCGYLAILWFTIAMLAATSFEKVTPL
jgi:hypothetical protein